MPLSTCSHNAMYQVGGICYLAAAVTLFSKVPVLYHMLSPANKQFISDAMNGQQVTRGPGTCPRPPPAVSWAYKKITREHPEYDDDVVDIGDEAGGYTELLAQALIESSGVAWYDFLPRLYVYDPRKDEELIRVEGQQPSMTLAQMKQYAAAIKQRLYYRMERKPGVYWVRIQTKKSDTSKMGPSLTRASLHQVNLIAAVGDMCVGGIISLHRKSTAVEKKRGSPDVAFHAVPFTMCRDAIRDNDLSHDNIPPFAATARPRQSHVTRGRARLEQDDEDEGLPAGKFLWRIDNYRSNHTVPPLPRMILCNGGRCVNRVPQQVDKVLRSLFIFPKGEKRTEATRGKNWHISQVHLVFAADTRPPAKRYTTRSSSPSTPTPRRHSAPIPMQRRRSTP